MERKPRKMKENEAAIIIGNIPIAPDDCYDITEYQQAKTIAIDALEKQIGKKIIKQTEDDREYEDYICPSCKNILQQRRKGAIRDLLYKFIYCHNCGQKLDWEDKMASMKFEKNSVEWKMFSEFWTLCQRLWIPEDNDTYWERVVKETDDFYKKYKDTNDIFVKKIAFALIDTLEGKSKADKK